MWRKEELCYRVVSGTEMLLSKMQIGSAPVMSDCIVALSLYINLRFLLIMKLLLEQWNECNYSNLPAEGGNTQDSRWSLFLETLELNVLNVFPVLRWSSTRLWRTTPCQTGPVWSTGSFSPSLTPLTTRCCNWFYSPSSKPQRDPVVDCVCLLRCGLACRWALPSRWPTLRASPSCLWAQGRRTTTCATWTPVRWSAPWWRPERLHVLLHTCPHPNGANRTLAAMLLIWRCPAASPSHLHEELMSQRGFSLL